MSEPNPEPGPDVNPDTIEPDVVPGLDPEPSADSDLPSEPGLLPA